MSDRGQAECWLTDMDGVLVHEGNALPGAAEFLQRLVERGRRFLVLTNTSIFTPRDLAARLSRSGQHGDQLTGGHVGRGPADVDGEWR